MLNDLAWLVFECQRLPRRRAIRRLRAARRLYELDLTDAEAAVIEAQTALRVLDEALSFANLQD
jgi:hypothetical protein